jgi:ribosomal protein S27AE
MGFFSEIDGELKPSDEYLATHKLEGYEEGDMEHEDYEVEDDEVAMSLMRKCKDCGKAFTLAGAIKEFDSYFDGEFFYMEEFVGQLCGKCAIVDVEQDFD